MSVGKYTDIPKGIPRHSHKDVGKSLIVASPAGSGKTQKLAERYVELLKHGVPPERILAITFTEKAAAEMKERVFSIIKTNYPILHEKIQTKLSQFRISTVHSFARLVLDRFAFELKLPPNLSVLDGIEAELMREEVIREGLVALGGENTEVSLWVRHLTLTEGWSKLQRNIRALFHHTPQSYMASAGIPETLENEYLTAWKYLHSSWGAEFWDATGFSRIPQPEKKREHLRAMVQSLKEVAPTFLTQQGTLRKRLPKGELEKEVFQSRGQALLHYLDRFWRWHSAVQSSGHIYVFKHLIKLYEKRKRTEMVLDFADMEYQLYRILYYSPNWSNVLQSFDEQTDHILLDEFQDTNGLQWAIVSKLVEEWRAGWGAKQEIGKTPTLFLVGDEKQSIYLFRGANVEVFNRAEREMKQWMGNAFLKVTVKENYRSLPLIVQFVNHVFQTLMNGGNYDWQTSYEPFSAMREPDYPGLVQILLTKTNPDSKIVEKKQAEADVIAAKIKQIVSRLPVYEKNAKGEEVQRSCRYEDITLLLRKRTHLSSYESALRSFAIPFVVVRGTGFHSAPEVVLLRHLVRFLANQTDDTALYDILRSPFISMSADLILNLMPEIGSQSLWQRLCAARQTECKKAVNWIKRVLKNVDAMPSAHLFENLLREKKIWSYYSDSQETENIRKFLRLLEDFDREGLRLYTIAGRLQRMSSREEEPKANINTEGMDAVKIMTIHAAKGLDAPVVFILGMEEASAKSEFLVVREEGEKVFLTFTGSAYKEHPERILWEAKLDEEQKRLFYVACTRARDALFLSGVWSAKISGWLSYLADALGMQQVMDEVELLNAPQDIECILSTSSPSNAVEESSDTSEPSVQPIVNLDRNWPQPRKKLRSVTHELRIEEGVYHNNIGLRHFGDIIHAILEGISKGSILFDELVIKRAVRGLVLSFDLAPSRILEYQNRVIKHLKGLKDTGLLETFILPCENAESEVEFVFRSGFQTITGRIDRVLIDEDGLRIIDYKSFPSNIEHISKFKEQLGFYAKAATKIFSKPVKGTYLLFTADAKLIELK